MLSEFLSVEFLPLIEAHFATKPKTATYYAYGGTSRSCGPGSCTRDS